MIARCCARAALTPFHLAGRAQAPYYRGCDPPDAEREGERKNQYFVLFATNRSTDDFSWFGLKKRIFIHRAIRAKFNPCRFNLQYRYLEGGDALEDFLEDFPTVSRKQAVALLEEASELLIAPA